MPLIDVAHQLIAAPVCDDADGNKQSAYAKRLTIDFDANGSVRVVAELLAHPVTAAGQPFSSRAIVPFPARIATDDATLVSAPGANGPGGQILDQQGTMPRADWLAKCQARADNVMLQDRYFEWCLHHAPVQIASLLLSYIAQADALTPSKFA